ncbi:MAG: SOS response-associated peptidase [Bacteroidales bacterium]|nr:SOS response-associated peptidase [Bacteroidales bacterium]
MCYHIAIHITREELEERFNVDYSKNLPHVPRYHVSAFQLPLVPVIQSGAANKISHSQWGLIPYWSKDKAFADQIRLKTFNARIEEAIEKPSYKLPMKQSRCLIPVKGFFEYHTHENKKYPFYIQSKNQEIFALAGIYDQWLDKSTGEQYDTFSILTMDANPMMEKIHNTKKRMPVVLTKRNEQLWLDISITPSDLIPSILKENKITMDAYPVTKKISRQGVDTNTPEFITPFKYSELEHFNV